MSSDQQDTYDNACESNPASTESERDTVEGDGDGEVVSDALNDTPPQPVESDNDDFEDGLTPQLSDDSGHNEDAGDLSLFPDLDLDAAHAEEDENISVFEMVRRTVQLLAINQTSKKPVKRADVIKYGMNSQPQYFGRVMRKVDSIFKDMFGLKIVKIKLDDNEQPCIDNDLDFGDSELAGFMFVTQYPGMPFEQNTENGFNFAMFM